ncbi:MAG: FAD/NAD(P)-binding protein [Patescibacteria group bacterium]
MLNIYQPQPVKIIKIKKQSPVVKLFTLQFLDKNLQKHFFWQPGQFIEVGVPGFGEAPFALCSDPNEKRFFELSIRAVGQLTNKIYELKKGAQLFIRGPFGQGFPEIKNQSALLVVGGLGLVPLRSLILNQISKNQAKQLTIFYGAKTPQDFLFKDEFKKWQEAGVKLYLTIDKTYPGWAGCVGVVTVLFDKVFKHPNYSPTANQQAFLCGPPVMYKFVLEKLHQYGFKDENIYLSLERRIHCGIGICQHCAIGSKYVCKDGPVFKWSEIKDIVNVV